VVQAAVASLARLARVDTVTSSVAGTFEPAVFRVSPNPGRGEVTIEMSLQSRVPEALHIYNVEGRLVRTLAPAVVNGAVRATWDGADLAGSPVGPGIYFLKVTGGSDRTKIVLLK
jgi:flagellar hook assembly protein FlgD